MTASEQLQRIQKKLMHACHYKPTCFGSDVHEWKLEPVLDEVTLDSILLAHQISLPQDYRLFITRIANGGAGPDYGLEPFQVDESWLNMTVPTLFEESRLRQISSEHKSGAISYDQAIRETVRWYCGDLPKEYYSSGKPVLLTYEGCTFFKLLITKGETAGRVMLFDGNGENNYYVSESFFQWYEDWLDRLP